MHRWSIRSLSLFAVVGSVAGIGYFTASPARSQLGVAKGYVEVQSTSPGTAQSGHANVSGTMRAGQFVGGGGGLSGLNASNLTSGTVPIARIPNPFILSGSDPNGVMRLTGTAVGFGGATLSSVSGVPSGQIGIAGYFRSNSNASYTVYVENSDTSGVGSGVLASTSAPNGVGVAGYNFASTGLGRAGVFQANGDAAIGVEINMPHPTGTTQGLGISVLSPNGTGMTVNTTATTGSATAGSFSTYAPNGYALNATNFSTDASTGAIRAFAQSSFAAAIRAENSANGPAGFFSAVKAGLRSFASGSNGTAGEFTSTGFNGVGLFSDVRPATGAPIAGQFLADSSSAKGITVSNSALTGLATAGEFVSSSLNGRGIISRTTATGSGDATAISATSAAVGGTGLFASATATSGLSRAIVAESASSSGIAVFARNSATSGAADAIGAIAVSPSAAGAYIRNTSPTGSAYGVLVDTLSPNGNGVVAFASQPGGVAYAVTGSAQATGWGLWANGRSGASGTKSFRIDHPLDPENKYLLHYSHEGPEPLNIYKGRVTTDAKGFAVVRMPSYFGSINRDPEYQLTVIDDSDDFVLAKVSREIENGEFVIRTSKPNVKVSWEVKAVRNDAYVARYGAPVEVEKLAHERGRYLHPELFGAAPQRGMFNSEREQVQAARQRKP